MAWLISIYKSMAHPRIIEILAVSNFFQIFMYKLWQQHSTFNKTDSMTCNFDKENLDCVNVAYEYKLVSFSKRGQKARNLAALMTKHFSVIPSSTWAATWRNQQTDWSAQSDQSFRCPHEETLGP